MSAKDTIPRRQTGQEHEQPFGGRGSGSVLRVLRMSRTEAGGHPNTSQQLPPVFVVRLLLMRNRALVPALGMCLLAGWLVSQSQPPRQTVGPTPDGGFLLNSGWKITPAGKQIPLDTFPMSSILSRDGKFLLVLNQGFKPPSISILRTDTYQETNRIPVKDGWLGFAMSSDGKAVYVGGGSTGAVFEFAYQDGNLTPGRTIQIVPAQSVTTSDFIGDVAISPDGRFLYAAGLYHDAIHLVNLSTARVTEKLPTGRRPYRILFHPDGKSYFVSSWVDGTVTQHKAETGERINFIRLGQHPTDMVIRARKQAENSESQQAFTHRIFVAAANTNNVYVVGIDSGRDMRLAENINISMTAREPFGMTPSAVAMNADQSRLFVVCSDANAAAAVDISEDTSVVLGFIPTAWYPTAVRSMPDNRLLIFNGRGLRSFPNATDPPNPTKRPAPSHIGGQAPGYVGNLQTGTMSVIDPWTDEQLDKWSQTVLANSPYRDERLDDAGVPPGGPIPTRPGEASPIRHVIYIVKENRTYDQVLGDLGKGNSDPSLNLFNEKVAPNHHKLARDFVLFDNFYVNADVSADGHNWSAAAIAPDYVQKMWPNSYAQRRRLYDYEGQERAAYPPAGYLWTNAIAAGISLRNYGWWATNFTPARPTGEVQIQAVRDSALTKFTNTKYRAFDLDYPDVDRAKIFLDDLREFEQRGEMPRLITLRLGNDHTSGVAPGKVAPLSAMADNDRALGLIVEGVSKTKFWPQTAIFVLEDDAQNGPDHVDSHRSPVFILSPYTRRGIIDSSMYNTTSVLRTMELILGLRPMTHFDAAALPMWAAFDKTPHPAPWASADPQWPLDERNPKTTAAAAARSARMDLSEADRADDDELNEILWRAIRQTDPPAPVRSFFVR